MRRLHATILFLVAALLPQGLKSQVTIPFNEDFDVTTVAQFTAQGFTAYGCTLTMTTSASCNTTKQLRFSGGGTTKNRVLVFPAFNEAINGLTLVFNTRPEGTSLNPGWFDVGYVTDATDTSTFVALQTYDCRTFGNACQLKECRFASAPTGARIAMRNRPRGSNYYWFVDDIEVLDTLGLCHWPTSLGMTAVSSTSVTLAAADSTGSTSDFRLILDGTDRGIFYNQTTVTGLTPGSTHTAEVRSVCGNDSSSHFLTYNFTTRCGYTEQAPFFDNMESHASAQTPACYTAIVEGFNGAFNYPRVLRNAAAAYSDTGYLRFQGRCNVLALPAVNLPGDQMHVSFYMRHEDTTSGTMRVGVLTVLGDTNSFIPLYTVTNHSTQYNEYEFWTDGVTADTSYVAFFWNAGSERAICRVDDITVEAAVGCRRPNQTFFDNVDTASVSLRWSDVGSFTEYQIAYNTSNDTTTATLVDGITDSVFTVTGLSAATDYWFWVRTVCTDTTAWQPFGSIRTLCLNGLTAPVHITFSAANSGQEPRCWTSMQTPSHISIMDDQYFGFGPVLEFYPYSGSSAVIAMPHIYLPANGMRVTVTAAIDPMDPAILELGYVTDLSSPASFVPMTSVTATTLTDYTFTTDTVDDDTLWVAFRCTSHAGQYDYAYISAVHVMDIAGCITPTAVTVDSVTDASAVVRWHSADAMSYEVAIAEFPDVDSSNIVSTSDTAVTITGLLPSTQYYVWVRADCGGNISEWTTMTPFRTMCDDGYCTINIHIADNDYGGDLFAYAQVAIVAVAGDEIAAIAGGTAAGGPVVDVNFPVCATDTVAFVWIDTSIYESYGIFSSISYSITLDNGTVLAAGNGANMTDGTVMLVAANPCSNCPPPQDLSINQTTDSSITVGWTPAAGVDSWIASLDGVVVDIVYDSFYTFTGLTVGTSYNLGVAALCSNGDYSQAATLTATTACNGGECEVQVDMWSLLEYNILWGGGNAVELYSGTSLRGSVYVPNGQSAATAYIGVCDGDSLVLRWHAGNNYSPACAFSVIIPGGDTLYTGTGTLSDSQLATATVHCTGCQRPDSVTLSAIGTNSATFSWPSTGATSYSLAVGDTVIVTTASTTTVTGLMPSTVYNYLLWADCQDGSSLATAGTFATACGPRPLPYFEDFESTEQAQMPVCWTSIGQFPDYMNTPTPSVYRSANMAHAGFNSLEIMGSPTVHPIAVSMPLTGEPADHLAISFYLDGATYTGMEAGLMTDPTDSNTFVPLLVVPQVVPGPAYYLFSTDSVIFTDSVYHFALRFRSNSILCGELYLDDLTIRRRPLCAEEFTHVAVTNISSSTAEVNWTVGIGDNPNATYTVSLLNANGDLADTFTTTYSTLLLSGLVPATTFGMIVQLNCGGTVTAVSDTISFTTLDTTAEPCLAPVVDSIVPGENYIIVYYTTASDSVELSLSSAGATATDTVIPAISPLTLHNLVHGTTYTISLRSLCANGSMSGWSTVTGTPWVDCGVPSGITVSDITFSTATVSWQAGGDEATWNIRIYNNVYDQTYLCTATEHTFTGLVAGMTYNVQVQALCGATGSVTGEWSEPQTFTTVNCRPVTDVTVSNIGGYGATVSWTPSADGNGNWIVEYGLHGFSRGEGISVTTTDNPYTITGLEPNTAYDVYVVTVCAPGINSVYSDSTGFTTTTAGIAAHDGAATLTITPNPAGGDVTVSVGEPSTVSVIDLQGRLVIEPTLVNSTLLIHHSSLHTGAYLVRSVNSHGTTVRKLIVR